MAYLIRQRKTYYVLAGKRVPKGTPGAKMVRAKSAKYYGCGIPGLPASKRVPLARDRETAQRLLNAAVAAAERGEVWMPDREAAKLPLADHLTAFAADLALGLTGNHRRRKAPSEHQVRTTVQRVRDALAECGFRQAGDLGPDAPAKLARSLNERLALPRTRKPGVRSGISAQSAAFILAAMRRFVRWLAARRLPVRPDLFDGIPGFDPSNNRTHLRREVSFEELAKLIESARASTAIRGGLDGSARAMLYLTAFATGFRASELARLTVACFDLDAALVTLPGDPRRKARRTARQPLPPGLVHQLRPWLTGEPAAIVWPGDWKLEPGHLLQFDLAAAGIPYRLDTIDGPRYADFHALRHSYLSALATVITNPKDLQELARHSDPRLTLGVYTHARPASLSAAVDKLLIPGATTGASAASYDTMTRAELIARIRELEAGRDTRRDTRAMDSRGEPR